jgi:hypothetical protein
MIYKSEFIISEDEKQYSALPNLIEHRERYALQEIPEFLIRDIGFQEVSPNRFKMEFMVFSRKEWRELKNENTDEAVSFGEWILRNNYSTTHWLGNYYFTKGDGIKNYKTAAQLYNIFKTPS